ANLEAAYALSPYADFLVASEELEPGHGWDYRTVLKPIAENPNISGRKLGREIAVGYEAHALVHFTFSSITLSVIQLKQLEDVISALDVFVKKAGSDIKNKSSMKLITKARARAEDYGNAPFVSSDMVDLVDMAYNLKDKYPDESKKLIEAVGKAVSYKIRGRGRPRANGISIYFPSRSRDRFIHNSWMYQNLPFSEPYKAFIKDYSNKLVADKYPVRFATTPKAEGSKSGNGKEKIYSIEFDPRESGDVAEVYSILAVAGGAKNPHIKFFLGLDDNVALSGNTASYRFEGQWLTLNGNYAPMFLLNKVKNEEGAEIKNYAIPVRVNGNKMDIMVLYDSSTKKYEILGARNPPDPKTGKVSRFLKKLEKGDKIIPQWRFYDSKKNYKGTKDGKEFVIEDELQISSKALPVDKAEFFLGFYSIDDARNESYSEYIRIE
ncbi:MAG: hypothetical protein KDK45_10015, partial [Leptospiraceae bacterium]|nr:hypothetical protein [Leptospiraceae bacterium]